MDGYKIIIIIALASLITKAIVSALKIKRKENLFIIDYVSLITIAPFLAVGLYAIIK